MNKAILTILIMVSGISNTAFCFQAKSNFAGIDKVKSKIQRAKNASIKVDKKTFKQYVEHAKKEEANKPASKLASIINASQGSTIKGLPQYTSKKEKEATDQVTYSKTLTDQFIKWANQFEIVKELKTNKSNGFIKLKSKIDKYYKNEKNVFIKFAQDLGSEYSDIEAQISTLTSLHNSFEVRSNAKISNEIEIILSQLLELQTNLDSLIEQAEELIDVSLYSFTKQLPIPHDEIKISPNYHFRTKTR